jgi:hypothetical protein
MGSGPAGGRGGRVTWAGPYGDWLLITGFDRYCKECLHECRVGHDVRFTSALPYSLMIVNFI